MHKIPNPDASHRGFLLRRKTLGFFQAHRFAVPACVVLLTAARRVGEQLVDFVRNGLLDPRGRPEQLRKLIPQTLPSGRAFLQFQYLNVRHRNAL